jgi:hypothetical protein
MAVKKMVSSVKREYYFINQFKNHNLTEKIINSNLILINLGEINYVKLFPEFKLSVLKIINC